jgi:hypothetical protein
VAEEAAERMPDVRDGGEQAGACTVEPLREDRVSDQKKELARVRLVDMRTSNSQVFEIPKFQKPPQWVSRHNKVYLLQSDGMYVEAFGYPLSFNKEPVKS